MNFTVRIVALTALMLAATSCASDKTGDPDPPGPGASTEKAYNKTIDTYLAERYLWNDEYKQLTRDLKQTYKDKDDNFLVTNLLKMSANTLDKKPGSGGGYTLYSYLTMKDKSRPTRDEQTRGVNHGVKREQKHSFGIAWLMIVQYVDNNNKPTGKYAIVVRSIYTDSPASESGVTRGTVITKTDKIELTSSNVVREANRLLSPSGPTSIELTDADGKLIKLSTRQIFTNPVLHWEVFDDNIGYLVYESFDAAYDDDLLVSIKKFKDAGISELILDLRYNGGGHVISSNMLSTCIAGSKSEGKVFQYYRYNDTRMANYSNTQKQTGHAYDSAKKRFYEKFSYGLYYGVDLKQYTLDLNRLYVLTTGSTASASELVINSLQGINFDVILIGERTNGKNVGMEVKKFDDGNYEYELAPITFQGYNAKNVSNYENGFAVDAQVNEWQNGLVDFGRTEPLVAQALSMITGRSYMAEVPATRSSAGTFVPDAAFRLPIDPLRPSGMLVLIEPDDE